MSDGWYASAYSSREQARRLSKLKELPMTDLRALLTRAGEALARIYEISNILVKRDPASYNIEGLGSEMRKIASALHAEITAALADATITIEQLDKLQFGRVLHERPAPDDGWRDITSAPEWIKATRHRRIGEHCCRTHTLDSSGKIIVVYHHPTTGAPMQWFVTPPPPAERKE